MHYWRLLSLSFTLFAVVATSKAGPRGQDVCVEGEEEGDDGGGPTTCGRVCGRSGPIFSSDLPQNDGEKSCSESLHLVLGVPAVLTKEHLASLPGIYLYIKDLETFGSLSPLMLPEVVTPFEVDVLANSRPLADHLAQSVLRLSWSVPSTTAGAVALNPMPAGFVYLPLTAELRQVLTQHEKTLAEARESLLEVHYVYRPKEKDDVHGYLPLEIASVGQSPDSPDDDEPEDPAEPPVPAAGKFRVSDALPFLHARNVLERPDIPVPTEARSFVAVYFTEAVQVTGDLKDAVVVKSKTSTETLASGWTLGQDGRALFGSFLHAGGEAVVIEFGAAFKGASGEALTGKSDPALTDAGIELKAAGVTLTTGDDETPEEDE